MAIGMSTSGGETPGANFTSNAHKHVIDIKQDLPKKETPKLNPFSPTTYLFTPLKPMSSSRSSSSRSSGSSASVTSGAKMNRSLSLPSFPISSAWTLSPRLPISSPQPLSPRLPISSPQPLSPRLPISSPQPLSNNQNPPMPFQDLQEAVLITNNQKLPDSVRSFFTASDELQDVARQLEESIKAVLEVWTSTSCRRDKLAASIDVLEEVVNKVKAAIQNQSNMQKKQESDGKSLDVELRRIILCKDNYNTIFTSLAALFGGCVFLAFKIHPVSVAVIEAVFAVGASYVSIAVKNRLDSYHDELKIPVEKRKERTKAISWACMLALEDLHYIEELASTLKSQTESMLGKVDSGATVSNAIVTEMETLKQGFQQLETKLDRCSKNAVSRSQALDNNILNKLD